MFADVRWFLRVVLLSSIYCTLASVPFKKFEYKYSFKPPYLAQKDGSVPFWEYGGNAIASSENVRLAPSLRSQKGAIWTKVKTMFDWWEVDILFRITGRGRIGADGLAFWYVEDKGAYDGPVFGSSDRWKGLGLFFDSFDNDGKHNNPYIMALVNDGTKEFDHANDGNGGLAGCLRDFRNKPFPTRAKVEYYMNTLTVLFHNGMTNNEQDFEVCLRVENVYLPKSGYFGLSAATGGLADDHDVIHFLTSSLYSPGQQPTLPGQQQRVSIEEEKKLAQEYAEYQKKLEIQKKEYEKEHPGHKEKDPEDWYESDSQREFRQIFVGMSQVLQQVRGLNQKLDEIVGRQERTISLVSNLATGVAPQIGQGHPPPPVHQPMGMDTLRRSDLDALIQNQNSILGLTREIRNYASEVHTKTETIIQTQARAPTAQVQSLGYDTVSLVSELRDGINGLKRDTENVAQRVMSQPPCASSCVTPIVLFLSLLGHLLLMFFYSLYKDSKESHSKKFY